MFNSPSSRLTPRRGPTRPRDSVSLSARASRASTSVYSESLAPPTPTIRPSRLAISRVPQSPTSSAGDTIRTIREYDGAERVTWARDDRFEVFSCGSLPREVQGLIKKADFISHTVNGHIDPVSGFAFVVSSEKCVAWNYQKRTNSSATCYTFPAAPVYSPTNQMPVMASLVSGANASEPGMILVSPNGEIRFWDSVGIALANVDRFQHLEIELPGDDSAESLFRVDGSNFVITTSSSLAFRLTISSQAGRSVPHIISLTRSAGMFARATSNIFPRNDKGDGITAVAAIEGAVYLLSGRILQKWIFGPEHNKFVSEWDLQDIFEREFHHQSAVVRLRDLVPCGQHKLAALVSYSAEQSTSYARNESYAVHMFAMSGSIQTDRIIPLLHRPESDSRSLASPKLYIPASSPTAFVRFADSIVLLSLFANDDYEDVLTLKEKGRNAFIGIGCQASPVTLRRTNAPTLTIMPITGGLMGLDILDGPTSGTEESSSTNQFKSKLEQAVFYGQRSDNPLSFDVHPPTAVEVAVAAEQLSSEILTSSSAHQPALFELKAALQDRLSRLKALMSFLRDNGLINRIPQGSRRRLSRDAEKAKAALDLWDYQNRLMEHLDSRSPYSLLADAIHSVSPQGTAAEDDVVRSFFRYQSSRLGDLLEAAFSQFRQAVPTTEARVDISHWIIEVNKIFITVLRAASLYRSEESALYGIDEENPPAEYWTASESILSNLEQLYIITEQNLRDRSRLLGTVIDDAAAESRDPNVSKQKKDQALLKTQLADLAAVICTNMEDKIRTHSQREMNGGADPNDGMSLKRRWDELRPRTIRPLVDFGRTDEAYQLAEHHHDLASLVYLCHDSIAGRGEAKVQSYIERFGEEFAFILYQWYIDNGKVYDLMTQDEVYGTLLTRFFELHSYPELAWLHHIACSRYGDASDSLVAANQQTALLGQKHLITSIGKLAAVADIKSKGDATQRKRILSEIDDELDLINIQDDLRVSLGKGKAIDKYIIEQTTTLGTRPTLSQLFDRLVRQLQSGQALDIEDLVDVLTLKDNRGVFSRDPVIALGRLVNESTIPEGRKQVALISTWRRIYIRDDWNIVADTKGRSEEGQRAILRGTLAYQTLKLIEEDSMFPQSFIISPYDSLTPPYPSELSARFSDWQPEDLEALMADHQAEIALLDGYIENAGLERLVKECAELVKRDRQSEGQNEETDVDM